MKTDKELLLDFIKQAGINYDEESEAWSNIDAIWFTHNDKESKYSVASIWFDFNKEGTLVSFEAVE
jgi:hypothetical protein